jgi:Leucine-rich repeat (LRR) protein
MPTLEILDMSKNRLTAFPEKPGRLARLKVLSLSYNKIYTLPAYLVDFKVLKVFKVDGNPIEWPVSIEYSLWGGKASLSRYDQPREVLGELIASPHSRARIDPNTSDLSAKKEEDLRPWIENMKSWMRQRAVETDRLLAQSQTDEDEYLAE